MRPHHRQDRPGFTYIELLVLLIVLGIILILLLPALQKVREAANKMSCAANLRQLGIATHNYHSDFDKLPAGYWGHTFAQQPLNPPVAGKMKGINPETAPFLWKGQQTGVLTALLPYLEQDNVYKLLLDRPQDPNDGLDFGIMMWNQDPWWTVSINRTWSQTRFTLLRCPSDTVNETTSKGVFVALHAYGNEFSGALIPSPQGNVMGRTNYIGCMGTIGYAMKEFNGGFTAIQPYSLYRGIFVNRSKLTLGQLTVKDGTSNTLMFGETLGGKGTGDRDYAFSWFGCGALPTGWGLGRANIDPSVNAEQAATWFKFSSRHAGVVQFCFGDGSVRGLRFANTGVWQSQDWQILQQLAGINDGRNDDPSTLMD